MKFYLCIFLSIILPSFAQDFYTQELLKRIPINPTDGFNIPYDAVANANNQIYVVGSFSHSNDFGGTNLTATNENGYLAKYDSNLNLLWVRTISGSINSLQTVALGWDDGDLIFVGGTFTGTVSLEGTTVSATAQYDALIAAYDGVGNFRWVKHYGTSGSHLTAKLHANSLQVTSCIETSGSIEGWNDRGGGDVLMLTITLGSLSTSSLLLGGNKSESCGGIAGDTSGFRYIALNTQSNPAIIGSENVTTLAGWNIVIAKFDAGNDNTWHRNYSTSGQEFIYDMAQDDSLDMYIVGYFTFSFGDIYPMSQYDAFMIKFSNRGDWLWSKTVRGQFNDYGKSVYASSDSVYFAGTNLGAVDGIIVPNYSYGAFVAKYTSDGMYKWSTGYNTYSSDSGKPVVAVGSGKIFVVDSVLGSFSSANQTVTSYSSTNMVLSVGTEILVSPSPTPSTTPTASATPSITPSRTPSTSPSVSPSRTPSRTPSKSITPSVTSTPSAGASSSATPTTSLSPTPSISAIPTSSATPSVTPTISATPSSAPSEVPTASSSSTPTSSASAVPSPSASPLADISFPPFISPSNSPGSSASPSSTPGLPILKDFELINSTTMDAAVPQIAIDSEDNIYIAGMNGTGLLIAKYDASMNLIWSKNLGYFILVTDVSVSGSDLVILGSVFGWVDFGDGNHTIDSFMTEFFVVKYDTDGNHQWSYFGAPFSIQCQTVHIGTDGSVYVGGGNTAWALLKFSSAGEIIWSNTYSLSGGIKDITEDSEGHLYLVGDTAAAIAKVSDADGTSLWNLTSSFTASLVWSGIDSNGDLYAAGFCMDVTVNNEFILSQGMYDICLLRYQSGGTVAWAKMIGAAGSESIIAASWGPDDTIVVTGSCLGVCTVGGQAFEGSSSFFVAAYSKDGTYQWHTLGRTGIAADVATGDGATDFVVSGFFIQQLNISDVTFNHNGTSGVLLKYSEPDQGSSEDSSKDAAGFQNWMIAVIAGGGFALLAAGLSVGLLIKRRAKRVLPESNSPVHYEL